LLLHPGVIALLSGGGLTLLLLASACVLGLKILSRWDIGDSSEAQLALERRTYLVSTMVQYALLFNVISAFLFIYTADDIHRLLVGAMCATGSLNSNPYGFPALYARIVSLFLAAGWIALNHLDSRAEDYPVTRAKYRLLLLVLPAAAAAYILEIIFFGAIDPDVITSCCGTLFSETGPGAGSSLASLPLVKTRVAFGAVCLALLASGIAAAVTGRRTFMVLLAASSVVFFFVALASVISFISLYFYQLPTHHCPFDILQAGYYYAGYPLYVSLFAGCFFGVMAGLVEPFRKIGSLSQVLPPVQRRWAVTATVFIAVFVIISMIPVIFTPFTLEGY